MELGSISFDLASLKNGGFKQDQHQPDDGAAGDGAGADGLLIVDQGPIAQALRVREVFARQPEEQQALRSFTGGRGLAVRYPSKHVYGLPAAHGAARGRLLS